MLSANPMKGEVAFPPVDVPGFEAGGVLRLSFNELCGLEGELGQKIEEIGGAALQSPTMMRTVFRMALEEAHGSVDSRAVGNIIQALSINTASELVLKAFTLSFPEAAKGGTENPPAKLAGTGGGASKSGARQAKTQVGSGRKPRASSLR